MFDKECAICGEGNDRDFMNYCQGDDCYEEICNKCIIIQQGMDEDDAEELDIEEIKIDTDNKNYRCSTCQAGLASDEKLLIHALEILGMDKHQLSDSYKISKILTA